MDKIEGMRAFVAVSSENSFTAGAKRLAISTNLASKYVRQLETYLGAQLFNRTTRSVTLTDIGRAYLERCTPLLEQFYELEGLVQERQSELAGTIRISAPTGFGSRQLVKAIGPFQEAHPNITIDLHLSDQYVAIVEEGYDLAIRFGQLKDSTLIARKLLSMRIVVCASSDYLAQRGRPLQPDSLTTHNCLIPTSAADPNHWAFCIDKVIERIRVSGSFHADSPRAIAHMAAEGLGIARCPYYAAEPFIKDGSLELLFEEMEVTELSLYAIYPSNRHLTARIRALIDHLVLTFNVK
ncbi:LysR family transcriptional regulator [Shewanella surugensis]|uniref:LysR family transcriptional regulator n=1 Tax=Shewanella surugensis TaxID=212020 RepID=A0ABT0LIC3_9GAMM|nr:LysR family transcriptional regulator [Shewanella surugensis]MCL1127444.1 LysR family transcriptional regulator [Shewanella surugensis]